MNHHVRLAAHHPSISSRSQRQRNLNQFHSISPYNDIKRRGHAKADNDPSDVHVLSQASVINHGNIINNVNASTSPTTNESVIDKLFRLISSRAMFNGDTREDAPRCHDETRQSIIADVEPWAIAIDEKNGIIWMKGPVGTGKSAIARRVCDDLNEQDPRLLIGSFFFWRNDPTRNSMKSFVPTIAYRLSVVMPEVRRVIEEVLSKDPFILDSTIEYQWTALVVKPFCQVLAQSQSSVPRALIVIDGLDECEPPTGQQQLLRLIIGFRQFARKQGLDGRIAFLVASRPEAHIRSEIESITAEHPSQFRLPHLTLTETMESREDMRLILTTSFNDIHRRRRAIIGECQWPPKGTIIHIIDLAKGQFIYPLTIVRWLKEEDGHPVQRLQSLLNPSNDPADNQKARALAPLDTLYDSILQLACSKDTGPLVLPCLFSITNPFPDGQVDTVRDLAELFQQERGYIRLALQPLHSVLRVPDDDRGIITIYHTSFVDYLHDKSRSRGYYVREAEVLTTVFLQSIKWANSDRKPTEKSVAMWLNIPVVTGSIIVTTPLLDALSEMNATAWLRERFSLAPLRPSLDRAKSSYIRLRQWLMSCLPSTHKERILLGFPRAVDLFQLRFSKWVSDLQSGLLTPRQTVLFLYALFALGIEEFDTATRPTFGRDVGRVGLGQILNTAHLHTSLLAADKHTCTARSLILEEKKWVDKMMLGEDRLWRSFLDFILPFWYLEDPTLGPPIAGARVSQLMFDSFDVLQTMVVDEGLVSAYVRCSFWRYLERMRVTDAPVLINRSSLSVLQRIAKYSTRCWSSHSAVRTTALWYIEKFGNLVPIALLSHWRKQECSPFPDILDVVAKLEEIKGSFPVNTCNCDEILGIPSSGSTPGSSPTSSTPSLPNRARSVHPSHPVSSLINTSSSSTQRRSRVSGKVTQPPASTTSTRASTPAKNSTQFLQIPSSAPGQITRTSSASTRSHSPSPISAVSSSTPHTLKPPKSLQDAGQSKSPIIKRSRSGLANDNHQKSSSDPVVKKWRY